jgi:hypothetical protein
LIGDGGYILQALGTAEGAQEASTLNFGAAKDAPLGENHRPGEHAERQQQKQDEFGDRPGFTDKIADFAANNQREKQEGIGIDA